MGEKLEKMSHLVPLLQVFRAKATHKENIKKVTDTYSIYRYIYN